MGEGGIPVSGTFSEQVLVLRAPRAHTGEDEDDEWVVTCIALLIVLNDRALVNTFLVGRSCAEAFVHQPTHEVSRVVGEHLLQPLVPNHAFVVNTRLWVRCGRDRQSRGGRSEDVVITVWFVHPPRGIHHDDPW